MTAKTNLVSTTFTVHAPAARPDYFLCKPNGRFGAPATLGLTDSPVDCKNCLRHPVTRYRQFTAEELEQALKLTRNEYRRAAIKQVLKEKG